MKPSVDTISPDSASTIPALFSERVRRDPQGVGYRYYNKITGSWQEISWAQMQQRVDLWTSALVRENFKPGDRVALMLPNGPEWICFDLAALALGLIVVPLYINDRPDNVSYILADTGAKLFLCPGRTCWKQLAPIFSGLGALQRILTLDTCDSPLRDDRITALSDWLPVSPLERSLHSPAPEDTATIVYTSGTTGPPKGVMLSHRNLIVNAHGGNQCVDIYRQDTFLSFLPLSHMLERTAGYYLPMMAGATVVFARSIPELAEDLATIKPTIMVSVPRIFERVYANIKSTLAEKPDFARKLFDMAVEVGWQKFEHDQGRSGWKPSLLLHPLLDHLVAKTIRERLGGNLRIIISGGAPLATTIARVFISLGLPIYQGYGLTETSPVISVNRQEDNNPSGVGLVLPGLEVRIAENGELLVRGDSVMQGYWNRPDATAATIDTDGWLHTGDKAEYMGNHLRITGRIKEIIVLSNGEKVSPADIEMAIAADPLFEQSMVIGEGYPYLVLLAVLDRPRWEMLAQKLGVEATEDSLALEKVHAAILERTGELLHSFPGHAFIRKVILSLEPWTVERGLLTPTMKIRRKSVMELMREEIDRIYSS